MKERLLSAGLLLLALLAASPVFAQQLGRILYVSNTDPACGGKFPCYRTIQAAVNAAARRDTVQIQAGTYTEQLTIDGKNNTASATDASRIVIEADPSVEAGSVVLRPPPASCVNGHAVLIRRSKFVTLRGLTITGARGAGVVLLGGSQHNQAIHIERSRIVGNGTSNCPAGGITIALGNTGTLIVNALIHGNSGNGITFADAGGGPHWLIQNTIHGNGWNGIGMVLGHTITLANNLITGNGRATGTLGGRHGVQRLGLPGQTPGSVRLLNNLICGNRLGEIQGPVFDEGDSGNLTPRGNEGPGVSASSGCGVPANVYANPNGPDGFPNTVDDDFGLATDSPAVDQGTDPRNLGLSIFFDAIFESDFAADFVRPSDADGDRFLAFDIGAFEVHNEAPIADAEPDQITFRGALVTINGNQSHDPEGASLTYRWTILSQPLGSNVLLSNPSSATQQFTPLVLGTYAFQLVVNDGELDSAPDTVQIDVINRTPMASNAAVTTNEKAPVSIILAASDLDDAGVSFSIVTGPANGSLGVISASNCVGNGAGSTCTAAVTYTPAPTYSGPDSFTFKVTDGSSNSNVATVSITVNAVNDAPVASSAAATAHEGTPVSIVLSGNDIDSSSLNFVIVTGPANGSLGSTSTPNCVANGAGSTCAATVTYTPAPTYNGPDSFTFKVTDGSSDSNVATLSIIVNAVNDAPVVSDDFYNTDKDRPLVMLGAGVLGNDNDLDGGQASLTAMLVRSPTHATGFTLNPDGSFSYTPAENFTGTDTFIYRASDGVSDSNEATVTIVVNQVNDAPIATNDFYNTSQDVALDIAARGVLSNDNDIDTPVSDATAILVTGPSYAASFILNADGSFNYVPRENFNGPDSFTYRANDGSNDSNVAMVTIAVSAVNEALAAENDTYAVAEDSVLIEAAPGVLANDSDIDAGQMGTVELVSGPTRAIDFQLSADGSFTYTPVSNFNGVDTFTYRVYGGTAYSDVAMVQIAVTNVNDAPVAQGQSVSTNENTPAIINLSASDIDSPNLSFSIANSPSHGSLTTNSGTMTCTAQGQGASCTGPLGYSPAGSYSGPDSFTFTVSDGVATSHTATVAISVIRVNHAPMANAGGPYTGNVGLPIQFVGAGADPDGDSLTFSWDFADGGTATGANPTHTYGASGVYAVSLTVADPSGATNTTQTTATVHAGVILNPIGNKTVNLGETLAFTVSSTNPGGGAVKLFVTPLPLMNNATFNASTGVFTFRPDTTQVGNFQLTFTAASGANSVSETITITVPNPPPGGTTAVRGRVYNLNNTPLGNVKVTLRASGHTAFSGNDGFFTISGVPSDRQELIVNGREANLGVHAILAVSVDLIQGVLNNLASPITLPDVDVEAEVQVSEVFTTVVTNPNVPGVELTILGGTARNSDGTPFNGKLSINPVPDYGRPESRPEELRPGMAITIQPAGIRFNPPARLTFPNADGMPPGSELNLWSLSPDTGTFSIVGKSVVSADGHSIVTFEGGVSASAWHFPLASSPVPAPNQGNSFCGSCRTQVGSEANLEEGSLYLTHTIPSYRSLGQSRALSLTYSSVTADPRPIVSLDTTLSVRAAVPNSFSSRLLVGGVQQGGETFTDTRSLPEDADSTSRISVQFDASNLVTGRYPYQATIFSNYLNSSIGGIATGNVIVLNRKQSPLGAGWAMTDLQQLYPQTDGTVLLTAGDGTALFFSGGPDTFTSPPGDFSTLVKNPDGTYTRAFKNGTKIDFNAQGWQTSLVDRNGNATNYNYDGNGRLLTITDPVGLVTTLTYSGGKLQKITDPAARETFFQIDSSGNLNRITNPGGTFVTYVYDTRGHITQATDERGSSTTYTYDFAGRFAQSTRPTGETRALVSSKLQGLADTAGGQGTPTNPAALVQSQNATASLTDGRGNPTRFTLDSLGQVISQTDALGNTTSIVRDTNGLPTRITRPNGAVTVMVYDDKGNLLNSTDPVGATTTFTYEPDFNQVKTIRDPKGGLTTINYDAKGNPIEIIDALGNRTQMAYDARGLLTSVTSAVGTPAQTTTGFTYNAQGNPVTTTDPLNNITTLAYDNAGNVFRSMDAESRVTEFTYDPRNRLISVLDANLKVTQYGYDPKGNLVQLRDAKNQTTTFTYDGLDRLVSATNPLGFIETFVYDTNGNLTSTTNRNGLTITFNYDALNRLTSKSRPPTSSEVGTQVVIYAYDSVGNMRSANNPVTNVFNQYDLANRLISSTSTTENNLSNEVVQINSDTTIGPNNAQFEGKTIQVNGRTLTLDGFHTFSNLMLINGATLTHTPTTATVAGRLDITVTGVLSVDPTSRIDVSGRGFLGGRQPGNPFGLDGMTVAFQRGSRGFSGGSYGGLGGGSFVNTVYGDFRNPNEPGSGGATIVNEFSGNGGGLVRIVAQTLQLNGAILANGQDGPANNSGGGSGGAIRIDVGALTGTGEIRANGGTSSFGGGAGGGGRIAIYYQTVSGFNASNVAAFAGSGGAANGGAGTIYFQGPEREAGELIVDNNNAGGPVTQILPTGLGQLNLTNLTVRRGSARVDDRLKLTGLTDIASQGQLTVGNPIVAATVNITGNSVLSHLSTTASVAPKLDLSADSVTIDATSKIDVSGRGFLGGLKAGNPFGADGMTAGFQRGSRATSGGSYGGSGGFSDPGVPNPIYGDFRDPVDSGSGGATTVNSPSGNGGGLVRIVAASVQLHGSILATGEDGPQNSSGGGSGGGVRIDADTLTGVGQIRANGGASSFAGGAGAGGRIAVYYQNANGFNLDNVSAFGGLAAGFQQNGAAGTVYLQGPTRENGELIVDNNNVTVPSLSSHLQNPPSGTINLTHLRIRRQARMRNDSVLTLTGTLEVSSNAELVSGGRVLAGTVSLTVNSLLSHIPTTATAASKVDLSGDNVTIDATSKIDVSGRGFLGGRQPGNPFGLDGMTVGFQRGSRGFSGGSYGGLGGFSSGGVPNAVYGGLANPNELGSGGATLVNETSGNGGGLVRIVAQIMELNGSILADGQNGPANNSGGGSGGGIRIDVRTLTGMGQISANGGASSFSGGAGGGGRIAVHYQNIAGFDTAKITASGGTGGVSGQNGTVHLQQQLAMLTPVMKGEADNDSTIDDAIRVSSVAVPRRRVFAPSDQSEIQNGKPVRSEVEVSEIQENLYLALAFKHEHEARSTNTSIDLDPIYTYDLNGNRTSMIDPTGLTTYTYDALNRLTSITNNKDQTTTFTYDALGRRTSMNHANGTVTSYTYDATSQLLTLAHQLGGTTINSFTYTYDKIGNRKSKADNAGTANYTYDALNRLVQAINPLPSNPLESFTYDAVGNRTNSNQNGSSTFNQANELSEDANFTYQYDNNGNMTRKTAKAGGAFSTYEYDAENKLVRVVSSSGAASNYKYDGLGRRVEKEVTNVGTTITRYVYDNEDILLELNGSNEVVTRYTHGPGIDAPLIMDKNGQSFFYHVDGLSSVTELTNQFGTVVQRYTYSSFGKIESVLDPNFMQPYTFTAREFDSETGLYYYRARYYDSTLGRFLQTDPIGIIGGSNLYVYSGNNPINVIDPLGLDYVDDAANIAAGLGDGISGGVTNYIREKMGINGVVDHCSWGYSVGWWTGFVHGIASGGASLLNGGAKTVLWSGTGAQEAAQAAKGGRKLLTDTPLGKLLDVVDDYVRLPRPIWKAASAVFAANAKGEVPVFLRSPTPQGVWNTVERPVLNFINRLHSAAIGSPATNIIIR